MCEICNPEVQRNFHDSYNKSQDIRITYYSYNNYFKLCCLEDYQRITHNLINNCHYNGLLSVNRENINNIISILYKNQIIIVHNHLIIVHGEYILTSTPHHHKLTIKIVNITEDILLESEVFDKLNTIQNLEILNNELKSENNELKLEISGINSLNNKLKSEKHILKKEVEYYNLIKPKYNYKEMRQTKKNLHNEYKRIYKLIKKNIGFNLI